MRLFFWFRLSRNVSIALPVGRDRPHEPKPVDPAQAAADAAFERKVHPFAWLITLGLAAWFIWSILHRHG